MTDANALLDAVLAESGMSHQGLASRINQAGAGRGLRLRYDHTSVARWLRGQTPRTRVQDVICEVIATRLGRVLTPADLGFAADPGTDSALPLAEFMSRSTALWRADHLDRAEVRDAEMLTGVHAIAPVWEWENPPEDNDVGQKGPLAVGTHEIEMLGDARIHYEQMYRRVGGLTTHARIASFLSLNAAPLLHGTYNDQTGRRLHRAIGGLVALAGVSSYDSDRHGLAQRYFHQSLRLAKSSADRGFGGYVLALLVNQSIALRDYRQAVAFAEVAMRSASGQMSPALVADLHAMQAKAYARMGQPSAAYAAIGPAEEAAANIRRSEEPPETDYVQPGFVETQLAGALTSLGDLKPAERYAQQALGSGAHARGEVNRLATICTLALRSGEIDRAAAYATIMADRAVGMESRRLHERLRTIRRTLADHPCSAATEAVARLDRALHLID